MSGFIIFQILNSYFTDKNYYNSHNYVSDRQLFVIHQKKNQREKIKEDINQNINN